MGEIVAVVGPSGAGKDSLMRAAKREMPEIAIVQRVITRRNPDLSEDFICVSDEQFQERINSGGFAVHWKAHGLNYGIPIEVHDTLATARIVLFNGSRAALADAKIAFSGLKVVEVRADSSVIFARLSERAREDNDEIVSRLKRSASIPEGIDPYAIIENSGDFEAAASMFIQALKPLRG